MRTELTSPANPKIKYVVKLRSCATREERRGRLDAELRVRIPMLGLADSLNVSAAATILVYEAVRQRIAAGLDVVPPAVPWHGEGHHDH